MSIGISYLAIPVDSADEAESLANYLNEHGVCAFQQSGHEVNCPLENDEMRQRVDVLKTTWQWFWDFSDSGLLGLACYMKTD
jgi:membrane-bound lytic murein transglycosylase B